MFQLQILELYLQPVTYDSILNFSLRSLKGQDCRDGFYIGQRHKLIQAKPLYVAEMLNRVLRGPAGR